jgi:predicted nucleotidyltransferase
MGGNYSTQALKCIEGRSLYVLQTTPTTALSSGTRRQRRSPIFKKLQRALPYIKATYGVKRIGIFGSFSRGEQTRTSDVDVLVVMEEEAISFKNMLQLGDFLEELFGRRVDLVRDECLGLIRPYVEDDVIWFEG